MILYSAMSNDDVGMVLLYKLNIINIIIIIRIIIIIIISHIRFYISFLLVSLELDGYVLVTDDLRYGIKHESLSYDRLPDE